MAHQQICGTLGDGKTPTNTATISNNNDRPFEFSKTHTIIGGTNNTTFSSPANWKRLLEQLQKFSVQ